MSAARIFAGWLAAANFVAVAWADQIHTVQPGDSLPKIVWLYGVSADRILAENRLATAQLQPGQQLHIPGDIRPRNASDVRAADPPVARAVRAAPAVPIAAPLPASDTAPAPAVQPDEPIVASAPLQSAGFRDAIAIPAARDVRYNGRWIPPGERATWVMDCSNTTRWLYQYVKGIDLPRTASGQYEWLRGRKRLWRVRPDAASLQRKLQPGDLLFWENTYKPTRTPPVTHVMVYLGTDGGGTMQMAGSQGARGLDVYSFDPARRMGGYRFFFFFQRDGKFVAYGRP